MDRLSLAACSAMVAVTAAGAASVRAAETAPKVAVINLSTVFDQYRLTKDLEDRFEAMRQQMAAEAKQKTDEITVKRQELARFKPESEDYKTRRSQVDEMEVQFEVWAATRERQLREDHKTWLLRIYHNVHKSVEAVSKEKGIDLVLTYDDVSDDAPDSKTLRQQLLLEKVFYFAGELDLTQTVIERLNKDYTVPENACRPVDAPPAEGTQAANPRPVEQASAS